MQWHATRSQTNQPKARKRASAASLPAPSAAAVVERVPEEMQKETGLSARPSGELPSGNRGPSDAVVRSTSEPIQVRSCAGVGDFGAAGRAECPGCASHPSHSASSNAHGRNTKGGCGWRVGSVPQDVESYRRPAPPHACRLAARQKQRQAGAPGGKAIQVVTGDLRTPLLPPPSPTLSVCCPAGGELRAREVGIPRASPPDAPPVRTGTTHGTRGSPARKSHLFR
ncbi:hypothetical protein DFJ74DRAFT_697774 [Hyaloraphidium curvatum]|nr:hypothetical protein DFJ74DRAFT_697774 [Hyaloraphidium curvatum]